MPALILDCDGVLGDTELEGHLPAFNQTFLEFGAPIVWSPEQYIELVKIGGGKERMRAAVTPEVCTALGIANTDQAIDAEVARWHQRKSEIYGELVRGGKIPARPGIRRLVKEAHDGGWTLAVASTSAEASVLAVLQHAVGTDLASSFAVFAGDVVPRKKPDPAIYRLALSELGREPSDAVVVEDSGNGLAAALAAGIRTVVTVSGTSRDDDFTGAALVVTSLGDPDGEAARVVDDPHGISPGPAVDLAAVQRILSIGAPS
ncbi:HAD-IA family hydrolase [Actinomycetospora endophytica]|uniref:HAD-IA family hydrolase n=1 Tax=Actinomycetospora endophytica TaxID=2291215 RepID=A0ABS8PHW4_9PSEU|nr:HAD-IA family hydrolase [Actinomycetospora endophytica]MCD2197882.1 HAD-IA family hydrolase [Actinomycetospora endophytica]